MRTNEQAKTPSTPVGEELKDVSEEQIVFQIYQRISRIENRMTSFENMIQQRLDLIAESCKGSGGSGVRRAVAEKPNIRNQLLAMLMKGWVPETEMLEKSGWTTVGTRSLITKLRTTGFSVETEERDGVPYYRIAK